MENINLEQELNTLMQRRLEELKNLNEKGVQTFAYSYDVDNYSSNIKNNFELYENKTVKIQKIR